MVFTASLLTVQAQYCTPLFSSACSSNDYIDLFSTTGGIQNITNVSTGCNGNPNNFVYNSTSTVSNVQGQGFSFSVQAGSAFGQGHRIWVDWNNDLDYTDPGEDMWNSGASSTSIYTGTITIPLSASPGTKRMRVRCNYASIPTDPCASQSFGEAEEFNLLVLSLGPCLSTPLVGATTSTKSITCAGETFQLGVSTMSYGSGQHYQWQKSADNITYTNTATSDTNVSLTTSQMTSNYYRLRVICSGGTPVYSTPVLVTTTAVALPAGTYTIDGNSATGGTNFNTFSDFKQAIVCGGIAGPVVVNVVSKGSAYAEQIEFGLIGGASAVNTITIKGNGQTLTSVGGTANYATLRLNGTKYMKIRNLKIEGTGTTSNFAVQVMGGAQYVEFDSCTVTMNLASTSSTTSAFVVSGSLTSATTAGNNVNNLTVKNSIIEGGYYAFTLVGASVGNLIENNIIRDFYLYGLYVTNQDSTIIRKNDINRAQRLGTITTFYGLYFTGTMTDVLVTGNKVHNSGDQNPLANYSAYPIYMSGANATVADPMFVTNNAVYEINTIGTVYALYLSSGNNIKFYHNSVNIDNSYATTSSGTIRAFVSFASTGTFELKNNIFQVSHVGIGQKHVIYLSSNLATFTMDYNQFYLNSTTGTNFFGYYQANVATFTAWKAVNSGAFEANGVYGDAVFSSNYYTPQSGVGDNNGTNLLSIVPTDLNGAARTATPDRGAMEFVPLACLQPTIMSGFATSTTMNITWQNVSGADSVRIEYGPVGFVQGTGVVVRRTGTSYTFTGLFPQTCYDFYYTSYCGGTIGNGTVKVTYCTECAAQALPLLENFDGYTASNSTLNPGLPSCWKYYRSKNHTGYAYSYTSLAPNSPLNHMRFYSGGTQVDTLAIISPALQGLTAGNKRTKFWAKSNSATTNARVIVGTVASPSQMNTLDIIDTVVAGQNYAEYTVYLDAANGYNGTHEYVVFMQGSINGTFQSMYLDDILIEQVPSCNPPTSISAPTIGTTTTQIAWTSLAGICFDIEYGPLGFVQGTGQGTLVSNVSSPYTATGLTPNTYYSVYVRDCCNLNAWAGPFTFKTNCLAQLNGTYTVGGTAGPNNFATLDSAFNVLTGCGISGPVTFNLQGASAKNISAKVINAINGGSATNTVTINGRGVALDTIKFNAGSAVGLTFSGAKHIKFQNMTIYGPGTAITIRMEQNAQFLTFENCNIWNSTTTTTFSQAVIAASNIATSATSAGNNANDITIKNCKIVGGYYGVSLYGTGTSTFSNNLTLEDNEFVDQYYYGLSMYYASNITVNRNYIHGFRNTFGYGIYGYYVSNVSVKQNEVFAPSYGIYLGQLNQVFVPTGNSEISNNFAGAGTYGIYMSGYAKANIWHNSVRGGTAGFYAFTPGADLDIRNNIFVGGSSYAFYNSTNPTTTFVLNNNLYYTNSTTQFAFNGTAYATLALWQTGQPTLNVNSLAGDPGFVSATDFHIISTMPNGVADNTVPVVLDIDGDVRPAPGSTIKDMGADEYTPLNWDASLEGVVVSLGGCGDSATTIGVVVKNFGLNTITSLPISVNITGGVTATVSTTAAVSIPVGTSATIPVGTFNTYAGAAGVNFAASIALVGDQKASNNTKSVGPGNYIPVEPLTHGMIDTLCASVDSVDLWAIGIPGTNYSWYDAAIAGNKLFSETDSITVPTNGITTYYVAYDSATATPLLGTGALTSSGTYITPYKTFYMDGRAQYLVLASEIAAMGVAGGGEISSLAFDVVTAFPLSMNAFEIKMGGTNITQMTSAFQPSPTTVVFSSAYVAVTGWNVHTFTTPFIWNGADNILIEVCFDNNSYTSNSSVHYTTTTFPSVTDGYADLSSTSGCVAGNITNQQVSSTRPDMQFNIKTIACSEIRKPVSFAISADSAVAAFASTVQANGADVSFDGTASAGQIYTWNFGDGNTGSGVTTTHTYATAGTWTACLTVEDTLCGDIDSICKTVVTTIGIDESLLNQTLNVYPNPSNGKFRVEFSVEGLKNVSLRVSSLLGQEIYTSNPGNVSGSYRADLDLSNQATGVYIIQIITDDSVVSRRITIRK